MKPIFEYDEYKGERLIDIDWQDAILLLLVALVFLAILRALIWG